jgi:hypothetical protein
MRRILHRDQAAMTKAWTRAWPQEAAEPGSQPAPRAAELFTEIAPAVIVHRIVIAGLPCDRLFLAHLVDDILLPLLRQP